MNTVVLKFGGSSVANNENLKIVAKKVIDFKEKYSNIVVIVSAQGKMTDNLIKEAKELSKVPNKRECDALLNVGEQITASKLAILLNELGHSSISLNGLQAGILTDSNFQKAKIINIQTKRIKKELNEGKIVVITGFQGVNNDMDITTLGRGGSDTSAVAIAAVLHAKHCYIFSDVDGVYTTDPRKNSNAKKLDFINYKEMEFASSEGAKVLHDRCVELADKYNLPIIAASTFNDNEGTEISNRSTLVESNEIKSIIKNDNILIIRILNKENYYNILEEVINNDIRIGNFETTKNYFQFTILKSERNNLEEILRKLDAKFEIIETTKISVVGTGISNRNDVLKIIVNVCKKEHNSIMYIDVSSYKISIQFNKVIDDKVLDELHEKLISV